CLKDLAVGLEGEGEGVCATAEFRLYLALEAESAVEAAIGVVTCEVIIGTPVKACRVPAGDDLAVRLNDQRSGLPGTGAAVAEAGGHGAGGAEGRGEKLTGRIGTI